MKKGLTEIVCVLDRSGSMGSIMSDAIGGLNSFITEQKKLDGDATITMALFDDGYDIIHDNVDINNVSEIGSDVYFPRGMTALYDAIGKTVTSVGQRLSKTDESERPEKVIVAILTDGLENCSREYESDTIQKIIKEQEDKYNWQFVYLAANQNAFDVGSQFGMKHHNSINFNATAKGAKNAFDNMTLYSSQVRSAEALDQNTMMNYKVIAEDK